MKKKKQETATILVLLVLILPALYLGFQLYTLLDRPYMTETAIRYDMSDSVVCDGFVSFNQQEVPGEGMLGYLVENGERVSVGTQVAEQYTDASQGDARRELNELDTQLELLKKSENTTANDVSILLSQRQSSFYDYLDQLDRENYQQAASKANDYLLSMNRLQITVGKNQNFAQARDEVEAKRQDAMSRIGSPNAITAPVGGYFISANRGNWLEYDPEQLAAMDAYSLREAFIGKQGIRTIEGAGKLVKSYVWRFYGVCSKEQGKKFEVGKSVQISFPGFAEEPLPAVVESVEPDEENGLVKVVVRCERVNTEVLGLSRAAAQIDFNSYKGIRINARALHIVDGEKGVYVKYGNLARWRKIQVLYQNDKYILVPEGGKKGTENEVRLFDEIIVEGTDLKDGKLLK